MTDQLTVRMFSTCAICGKHLNGRADKRTCSQTCRTELSNRRKRNRDNSKMLSLLPVAFDPALSAIKLQAVGSFNMLAEQMYSGVSIKQLAMSTIASYIAVVSCRAECGLIDDTTLANCFDYVIALNNVVRSMGVEFTNVIP